jgi:hypothetical protein
MKLGVIGLAIVAGAVISLTLSPAVAHARMAK